MKLLLSVAAVAVFTAGSSFAQTQPETPVAPPPELTVPATPPAPEAESDRARMERRAEWQREREMRWHRKMRDGHWRGWRRDGRDRPEAGARFRVEVDEDGSMKFDVRCAANEPMQTCADVMMRLFDRLDPGGSTQLPQNEAAPPSQED